MIAGGAWLIQDRIATANNTYQSQTAQATISLEYVKLGVGIVSQPTKAGDEAAKALREWAVEVVDKHADPKLTARAKHVLRTGEASFPIVDVRFPPVDGYCEVNPQSAKVGEPVRFGAYGQGGTQYYAFSWAGDDGISFGGKSFDATYHTPGRKAATVRITSNGASVYRTCTTEIIPPEGRPEMVKADVVPVE